MLKNIPSILSPELLKILMEMGHGDEIVLGDGNFPSASYAKRLVRLDGHGIPEILDAILQFFPLDQFVDEPVFFMDPGTDDEGKQKDDPPIWAEYRKIIEKHEPGFNGYDLTGRMSFYEQAKEAYAIVAASEKALYGNIILKKGVIS